MLAIKHVFPCLGIADARSMFGGGYWKIVFGFGESEYLYSFRNQILKFPVNSLNIGPPPLASEWLPVPMLDLLLVFSFIDVLVMWGSLFFCNCGSFPSPQCWEHQCWPCAESARVHAETCPAGPPHENSLGCYGSRATHWWVCLVGTMMMCVTVWQLVGLIATGSYGAALQGYVKAGIQDSNFFEVEVSESVWNQQVD